MVVLTFIGSGKYSDVFKVTDGRGHSVVMKLSYYRDATICNLVDRAKDPSKPKVRDSISVSAAFGKVTNAMVSQGASPHFVTILCEADCANLSKRLAPILGDRLKTASKLQLKYNHVCFMEVFTEDMTKWLRKGPPDEQVRAAIFQVLYTLAALQAKFPSFRHNDLSTNNVLVKKLPKSTPFSAGYVLPDGTSFAVKDLPVLIALNDYDFTHVDGIPALENERVLSKKYKVTNAPNPTYDTHFFLKSVWKTTSSQPAKDFLRTLPLKKEDRLEDYNVENNPGSGVRGVVIPGLEPLALLYHPYFAPLQNSQATAPVYRF